MDGASNGERVVDEERIAGRERNRAERKGAGTRRDEGEGGEREK